MKQTLKMNNQTKSTVLCRQSGQFQCNLHLDSSNWQNDSIKRKYSFKKSVQKFRHNKQTNTKVEKQTAKSALLMLLLFKPMKMVTCLCVHY